MEFLNKECIIIPCALLSKSQQTAQYWTKKFSKCNKKLEFSLLLVNHKNLTYTHKVKCLQASEKGLHSHPSVKSSLLIRYWDPRILVLNEKA